HGPGIVNFMYVRGQERGGWKWVCRGAPWRRVVPIVAPVVALLDFGLPSEQVMIWFAIALAVNLQTSFLTPPFGYALFYLRGIAPDLPISVIYRGVIPFVLIQLTALLLVIVFPVLALWLPMAAR
ncbi:MAG: TRAP transporter large permease subunit, partial [Paracoccus sp. (in: a-proteobacteria)]|nr:TRAP transporter large permease subunit [Paracoccus sp. (in: a-proteobacteria)]